MALGDGGSFENRNKRVLYLAEPSLIIPLKKRFDRNKKVDIVSSSTIAMPQNIVNSIIRNKPLVYIHFGALGKLIKFHVGKGYYSLGTIEMKGIDAIRITSISIYNVKKYFWNRDMWVGTIGFDVLQVRKR